MIKTRRQKASEGGLIFIMLLLVFAGVSYAGLETADWTSLNNTFVKLSGGNMTGNLNSTENMTAQYYHGSGAYLTGITAEAEVTDIWVNESGDNMTGNLDMNTHNIWNVSGIGRDTGESKIDFFGGYESSEGGMTLLPNGSSMMDGDLYYSGNTYITETQAVNGSINPLIDDVFSLGNSTHRWNNLYTSNITNTGSITLKPSSDSDDYLYFSTGGGIPRLGMIGTGIFYVQSDSATLTTIKFYDAAGSSFIVGQQKSSDYSLLQSENTIRLITNSILTDYWQFSTTDTVPKMSAIGGDGLITNIADPTDAQDVMTKNYVDTKLMYNDSTFPGSPIEGQLFYDTDDEAFYRYDSIATAWIQVGGGGMGTVSNDSYSSSWDDINDTAPSKNAVYDEINSHETNSVEHNGDLIIIRDEKTIGTHSGTFISGAWQTRTLNVEAVDEGNHCTLDSNQFTLTAGTYRIRASAPAYDCLAHQIRLRNIDDASTPITGTIAYANTGGNVQNRSFLVGTFTIASSKAFEIQHYGGETKNTFGFGVAGGITTEVYTIVELIKVA